MIFTVGYERIRVAIRSKEKNSSQSLATIRSDSKAAPVFDEAVGEAYYT